MSLHDFVRRRDVTLALKMETVRISKMLVSTYQPTRHQNQGRHIGLRFPSSDQKIFEKLQKLPELLTTALFC